MDDHVLKNVLHDHDTKSQSNWLSSNSQIRPIFRVLWGSSQGLIRSCVGDQVRNLSTWHVFPIWAVGRGHGVEKCNNRLSSWISVKHRKFIILHKLHKWMMRPSSRIAWMMMEALQKTQNLEEGRERSFWRSAWSSWYLGWLRWWAIASGYKRPGLPGLGEPCAINS